MSPADLRRWHQRVGNPPVPDHPRPASRADCQCGPRPCPLVGCRHHLYLEVKPSGAITASWPHLEPWEIPESCALDVAERGEHTLDEIGELLNLSCERVRKIEAQALAQLHEKHGDALARLWRGEQDEQHAAVVDEALPGNSEPQAPASSAGRLSEEHPTLGPRVP